MKEGTLTPTELARIQIFSSWNKRQLTKLASKTRVQSCDEHELIYATDTINQSCIIVKEGLLEKVMITDDVAAPFDVLSKDMVWGSGSIINPGTKYPYDIRAASAATIASIKIYDILKIIDGEEALLTPFMHDIAGYEADQKKRYEQRIGTLSAIMALLHNKNTQANTLHSILQVLANALGGRQALIARFEPASNMITIEQSFAYVPELAGKTFMLSTDTVLSRIYATQKSFRIGQDTFENKYSSTTYARKTMLASPITAANAVIGALLVADAKNAAGFLADDMLLLTMAAQLLASEFVQTKTHETHTAREHLKRSYIGSLLKW